MARRRKRSGASNASPKHSRPLRVADAQPGRTHFDRTDFGIAAVVAGGAGILYCATAARDIVLGDTPELVTAAVSLGVPHAPGYPLVTMLGHLFSLLSVGPLPFRVGLLDVACGTGTVVTVYLTSLRLTGSRAASACAALALAFSPLFWSWSLVAEVFSLNNLLAAIFVYLLVLWYGRPDRLGLLAGAAFTSALALTNQQTIVLMGPAVLLLLWGRRNYLLARPAMSAAIAAAFLAGLLPYAYLPWAASRHPIMSFGDASTLSNFLDVVTRKHFGTGQLINAPKYMGGSPVDRLVALGASFGIIMGMPLLLGAIHAYRQCRWYFWFSLLAFAFTGPVFVAYANINLSVPLTRFVLERFYLLSHVVLAPLVAFGVLLVTGLVASVVPRSWCKGFDSTAAGRKLPRLDLNSARGASTALVTAAMLLCITAGVIANYREIDQSKNHAARRFAEDIFATLEPDSILLVNGDEVINPLTYLQSVERYRPDVALVVMPLLPTDWYLAQLRRQYPDMVIPFDRFDGQTGTLKSLVQANSSRPIAVIGVDSDESLKGNYWFYRRGLVAMVEPMSKDVRLDELMADNQQLLSRYKPPAPADIKSNSLELTILTHYATPAVVVASQCEQLHYYPQAREWYGRALSLNPSLTEINTALARLPGQQ
jgi:4-amino-4-deoxy-L-arabinose transferase-like glycosyltransferase